MNPKVAAVLLVILVALFMLGAGFGLTGDDSQPVDVGPSWVERIGTFLGLMKPLDSEEIGATTPSGCRQQLLQGTVLVSSVTGCTFLIKKSSSMLPVIRTFTLSLEEGANARVILAQEEQITVKVTLSEDTPAETFHVQQDGGAIHIQCLGPITVVCKIGFPSLE
jgi:hypothetical protein